MPLSDLAITLYEKCHPSCRTCTGECLLLQRLGVNGRGLAELCQNNADAAIPFSCTACGLCTVTCNRRLDPALLLRAWRQAGVQAESACLAYASPRQIDRPDHLYAAYRRTFGDEPGRENAERAKTIFFPGCALRTFTPDLADAAFEYLRQREPGIGWLDACCSDPLDKLGFEARWAAAEQRLGATLGAMGVERVITACPTCHYRLLGSWPRLEVVSIYEVLARERRASIHTDRVLAIHDACPDRHRRTLGTAVRSMIRSGLVLMKHEGKRALCCGAGADVQFLAPEMAQAMTERRWAEAAKSGAQGLITYCATCAVQLAAPAASRPAPMPVVHFLDLVFNTQHDYALIARRVQSLVAAQEVHSV